MRGLVGGRGWRAAGDWGWVRGMNSQTPEMCGMENAAVKSEVVLFCSLTQQQMELVSGLVGSRGGGRGGRQLKLSAQSITEGVFRWAGTHGRAEG